MERLDLVELSPTLGFWYCGGVATFIVSATASERPDLDGEASRFWALGFDDPLKRGDVRGMMLTQAKMMSVRSHNILRIVHM